MKFRLSRNLNQIIMIERINDGTTIINKQLT